MRINTAPTEAIALDAYYIAQAVAHQQDQIARLASATNLSAQRRLQDDIVRLNDLIEIRVAAWVANYGTATVWTQHLDGTKYAGKVAA